MAVNIPLNKNDKNNITIISSKHLVVNIIRCFFALCAFLICFNVGFVLACGCEENIIKYKKLYSQQSSVLNKQEFRNNKFVSAKVIKPAIVNKPQVIYPHTKPANSKDLPDTGVFESSFNNYSSDYSGFGVGVNPEEFRSKKFVGAEKCKLCHSVEYRKWQKTKHAQAYMNMNKHYEEEKDTNKKHGIEKTDCESCHTTGYGYNFGFRKENAQKKLVNVQCEVCHGPGEEHSKNYKQKMIFGENPIPEALCKSCHYEDIDPKFKFGEYLEKINCTPIHQSD